MNANIVGDPWERMGWHFIGVSATLIILMHCWVALDRAIHFIVALGRIDRNPIGT
jgi:hypothetical protein